MMFRIQSEKAETIGKFSRVRSVRQTDHQKVGLSDQQSDQHKDLRPPDRPPNRPPDRPTNRLSHRPTDRTTARVTDLQAH